MDFLIDSFFSAILLVISLDPEMVDIVEVSLKVSATSTLLASLIGLTLLSEPLTWRYAIGMLMAIGGVYLIITR